jgi:hypothetical protein
MYRTACLAAEIESNLGQHREEYVKITTFYVHVAGVLRPSDMNRAVGNHYLQAIGRSADWSHTKSRQQSAPVTLAIN